MRCTNIIKSGESLLTLISDLKECLIFKDFPAINQSLASQKVPFLVPSQSKGTIRIVVLK